MISGYTFKCHVGKERWTTKVLVYPICFNTSSIIYLSVCMCKVFSSISFFSFNCGNSHQYFGCKIDGKWHEKKFIQFVLFIVSPFLPSFFQEVRMGELHMFKFILFTGSSHLLVNTSLALYKQRVK